MKIGILTYHRSVNEGSVLQAYCLQQLLQTLKPDALVEIIDYRPLTVEKRDFLKSFSKRPPFFRIGQWNKRRTLSAFRKKYCIFSHGKCITNSLDKIRRFIINQRYDAIFVGSDTVWRIRDKKENQPVPNIYFLPDIDIKLKIAFAVSFDLTDRRLLNISTKQKITDMINGFDFISVRDENSADYLRDFGFKEDAFTFMPDPTILWNFSSLVEPAEDLKSNLPLAGVAVPSNIRKQVTEILIKMGFYVVNLLGSPVKGQIQIPHHFSFRQRLGIYPLLNVMITDRFHGSILTFKLGNAPVIYLENFRKYPSKIISKGRDLFRRLDVEWSIYRYFDNNISHDAIADILISWDKFKPDINMKLINLNKSAEVLINNLFRAYV